MYTAGDTITYKRLADTVDALLGRNVRRVELKVAKLKDDLANEPDSTIRKYRVVFAEGKGVAWQMDKTFNAQRGASRASGVERWMRHNLK